MEAYMCWMVMAEGSDIGFRLIMMDIGGRIGRHLGGPVENLVSGMGRSCRHNGKDRHDVCPPIGF